LSCLVFSSLLFLLFSGLALPWGVPCLALGLPLPLGLSFACCALAFSCVFVCAFFAFAYACLCFSFVLEVNKCLDLSFHFYMQLFNNIAAYHKE
jgi:hypothetical protein